MDAFDTRSDPRQVFNSDSCHGHDARLNEAKRVSVELSERARLVASQFATNAISPMPWSLNGLAASPNS